MATPTAIVTGSYWGAWQDVNAGTAIRHQLQELEAAGTIDNFRLVAGEMTGFRHGLFFTDSDFYKWLEAAARIEGTHPDAELTRTVDAMVALVARAQAADGYLFTFNQVHFPRVRFKNLLLEHEIYCFGHLIEAGVARLHATGRRDLLRVARRAADCLVAHGRDRAALAFGHEGIELALLKLHAATDHAPYLELARQMIEQRGRGAGFRRAMLAQIVSTVSRLVRVQLRWTRYRMIHPQSRPPRAERFNAARKPKGIGRRALAALLDGRYLQHHAPVRAQTTPEGHAVCFGYLQTGTTMLARLTADRSLLPPLTASWEHMVTRRMSVTGGVGALPGIEGFGADYELDPEVAYNESCAALASIFWNWEMAQLTGEARYGDLLEWQLYNAASVGMGRDGTTYLYNNPLACRDVMRRRWFKVPCCPSNLSRTFAGVAQYIGSDDDRAVWLHQYISSRITTRHATIALHSDLPWHGRVRVQVAAVAADTAFSLFLRVPSWARAGEDAPAARLNGETFPVPAAVGPMEATAQGYDPRLAQFLPIHRRWQSGDCVELDLPMPALIRRAHPRVRDHAGKGCITRGPLVYALESVDHPGIDIFTVALIPDSLQVRWDERLLGGVQTIAARARCGAPLTLIPYPLWGNRGPSQLAVWVNLAG